MRWLLFWELEFIVPRKLEVQGEPVFFPPLSFDANQPRDEETTWRRVGQYQGEASK